MSKKLENLRQLRDSINITVNFEKELNEGPNLFVANHNLLKDIVYLPMAINSEMVSMISPRLLYKNDVKRKTFVNNYLYGIPIEAHGGPLYANMCLNMGSFLLQNGISVGIFPEGAYIEENEIHRGRTGAIRMLFGALENNCNINLVPVAIKTPKDKDKLDDYECFNDHIEIHVLKPIDYSSDYQCYSQTDDLKQKNFCLHNVMDQAMRNIAESIDIPYIDNYIELFKKNNVIFANGEVIPTDLAQNPEYLNLYENEINTTAKQYIKELK